MIDGILDSGNVIAFQVGTFFRIVEDLTCQAQIAIKLHHRRQWISGRVEQPRLDPLTGDPGIQHPRTTRQSTRVGGDGHGDCGRCKRQLADLRRYQAIVRRSESHPGAGHRRAAIEDAGLEGLSLR